MRFAKGLKITSIAFLTMLSCMPALAVSMVEGRLMGSSKATGDYDLLIRVWGKQGNAKKSQLLQTIQIARVSVVDGGFKIALDASLESRAQTELSYKIEARPFEGGEPFSPAEISRVLTQTVKQDLVLR
ncbi:MAG: hypothetical protein JWO30_4400 [Fibrobacteres bacterium]|nr:hypothetical protein [Fibrobacterota bacterium]